MIALHARSIRALALTSVAAVALAACGGSSSTPAVAASTPPPASLESKFGAGFATDYDAMANTEPAAITGSEINALSLTTEPIPLS